MGITMQSCKEDTNAPSLENQVTQPKANVASWNQVQQQLKALDMSYGLTKNIRRAPCIPEGIDQVLYYNNWELDDMGFNWAVANADADGVYEGITAGGGMGAAIGFLSGGPAGSAWGTLIGGAIGGVAWGAFRSVSKYIELNGTQVVINPSHPFIYIPHGNRFADGNLAPVASELGDLHNCLVSEMLQDANFMELTSLEDRFDYICAANITSLSDYFTSSQIAEVQAYLADNRTYLLDSIDIYTQMITQVYVDELNIIKHYAYVVSQTTTPFDMEQYTSDFMQLVDDAYADNQISEESALIINGTISTMYCSYTAWNYIQPDPYQTTLYAVNTDDMWYFVRREQLDAIIAGGDTINFVGYPYIDNDTLKRIYVYANNSYNVNYANDSVMQILFDGTVYENETSDWTAYNLSLDNNPIPTGYYPIYPAEGYDNYVYIDFEDQ